MPDTYRHQIRLLGEGADGTRISGALLRDLLDVLVEGCRGALRLRAEGRSFAPGNPPSWLHAAADFDLLPFEEGSTIVPLEAPPIAQGAPKRFAQFNFLEIDPNRSALSFFEESLDQALAGNDEAELFDQPLLQRFTGFSKLLSDGFRLEITSDEPQSPRRLIVEAPRLERVQQLIRKTPPPQRVRLGGKLDTIRHSDRMFTLVLVNRETVKGVAEGVAAERLASFFGKEVTVHGTAVFRPSGTVLRVETDEITSAEGDLEVWSHPPRPLLGALDQHSLVSDQRGRSGLNAICGRWPGEEPDEVVAAALADMS